MYPSSSAFSPDDYPMPYSPNMVPNGNPPMQPLDFPLQQQQYAVNQQDFGMMYPQEQKVAPFNPAPQNMQNDCKMNVPVHQQDLGMMYPQDQQVPFNPQNMQFGMNVPFDHGYAHNADPFAYDQNMLPGFPNPMDYFAAVPYPDPHQFASSNGLPINTPPPNFDDYSGQGSVSRKMKKNKEKKMSTMHLNTSCSNCGVRETKLWRRNEKGAPECNACNLYFRMKGVVRPQNLWNKPTATRKRRPMAPVADENQVKNEGDNQ